MGKMAAKARGAVHCIAIHLFLVLASLMLAYGSGCASRTFRAADLPPELAAPASLDLQSLNLSGLANQSVSVEVIQPGDVLEVSMVTDYSNLHATATPLRVSDDGMVVVPLVGKVSVGGLEIEQAEQAINAESVERGVFRNPCITVTMKQYRTKKVAVVGAVKKPGPYELPRGSSSLLAALNAAEGLSDEAGTEVEIRHTDSRQALARSPSNALSASTPGDGAEGEVSPASYQQTMPGVLGPEVIKVDLADASAGKAQVPELRDGDVVHVAKRTLPPVYVIGLVRRPGEFAFPTSQELRVLDALALAGGISNPVADDIIVIRKVEDRVDPVRIAVSLQGAKNGRDNLPLAPGDTVTVEQNPATVFVDVVRTFVHFGIGSTIPMF